MSAWQGLVPIVARQDLSAEYFELTFASPEIAAGAAPGLFVNLRVDAPETCLRRPISFHDVNGDLITLVVGVTGTGLPNGRQATPSTCSARAADVASAWSRA
ncbi:MAG: hypothetical protein HYU66_01430 [Armatimonadetes bacterium]|nr:hypothetical protein [Armatimonadota bacterium]